MNDLLVSARDIDWNTLFVFWGSRLLGAAIVIPAFIIIRLMSYRK